MPRKKEVPEEEIDLKQPKKMSYITNWFNEVCVNNRSEIEKVCYNTARDAASQFSMSVRSDNTEVFAAVFYGTFITILEFLRSQQKNHRSKFSIQICNSINIGYTNNTSEDNEKIGNFMPILEHIGTNRSIVDYDDKSIDASRTRENFIRWKELNIKNTVEYYKDIQERAFERLNNEFRLNVRTSEAIIPLFCIFMDHIGNVLKEMFREAEGTDVSEVHMNVLGLFDAYYSFNEEENLEVIDYCANIKMKLALKSDDVAGME